MIPLIIFDLDDTLAESKQPLTGEMATLLAKLLAVTKVGVASGGALPQFIKQVVDRLPRHANLANLYLLPTSGAALYEWKNDEWNKIYEERLTEKEEKIIETAMREVAKETGIIDFSEPSWGERIEYRGDQVTMSALGQNAPVAEKEAWDPDHSKRHALQEKIAARLPQFSVRMGGSTTIDVTKPGVDKAYGVRQLCKRLNIPESKALYIGDELEAGGNDEAVYKTDIATCAVKDPADTERTIKSILSKY
jgi:HAD superfamily hydrolase (TIGR01484 family)